MTGDEKYMFELKEREKICVWDGRENFDKLWAAANSDGKDGVLDYDGMVAFYRNAFPH